MFDRLIVSKKKLLNLIGWFEEENWRFSIKTEQISNLIGQEKAMWENKQKVEFFLACLLAQLAGLSRFRLVVDLAIGLTIDLAIGRTESMGGKVAVNFSRWFLWNDLINFLRC